MTQKQAISERRFTGDIQGEVSPCSYTGFFGLTERSHQSSTSRLREAQSCYS